jgi:WD40 repeat protein
MYDLRKAQAATEAETRLPQTEKKRKRDQKGRTNRKLPFPHSSNYFIRYKYRNEDVQGLGMDVSPRLGLIASADEDNKVDVWNMYTGQLVKKFKSEGQTEPRRSEDARRIKCVKFVEDGDGETSLWATVDGGVTKFAW